jgi:hypothetical protein
MVVVAPIAQVTLRALLIPLGTLLAFMIARGLISIADALVRALFSTAQGVVGWIPWVGKVVAAPIHTIEQKVIALLTEAAGAADAKIGAALHSLDRLVRRIADQIAADAIFDWQLVKWLEAHSNPAYIVRQIRGHVLTERQVRAMLRAAAAIAVRPVTLRLGRLDTWTHAQIRALRHSITVTIPNDIAGLRARTRAAEDAAQNAWAKVRELDARWAAAAFAGAVAVALSRLNLGWVRCSKVGRLGRFGCGMDDSLLEAILADALLIVGTLSLVELAEELQPLVGESARLVQGFWRVG